MRNGMTWFARVAARLWLAGSFAQAYGEEPLADDATVVALAVALPCAGEPEAAPPDPAAGRPAEVELVATVRAKALRFDEVPAADVLLPQGGARRWGWRTERVNLPAQPEPGVVYRDVEVRLTVSGDRDEYSDVDALRRLTEPLGERPRLVVLPGVDHFWWGSDQRLAEVVAPFLRQTLSLGESGQNQTPA